MGRNYFPTNWTIFYAKITCPSCSGKGNIIKNHVQDKRRKTIYTKKNFRTKNSKEFQIIMKLKWIKKDHLVLQQNKLKIRIFRFKYDIENSLIENMNVIYT
jgi:hypothetical protein